MLAALALQATIALRALVVDGRDPRMVVQVVEDEGRLVLRASTEWDALDLCPHLAAWLARRGQHAVIIPRPAGVRPAVLDEDSRWRYRAGDALPYSVVHEVREVKLTSAQSAALRRCVVNGSDSASLTHRTFTALARLELVARQRGTFLVVDKTVIDTGCWIPTLAGRAAAVGKAP